MKGKYLVTTDAWFYAPNGLRYKSAWGEVKVLDDTTIGIKTNRNSTNWYVFIGSEEKGIIVAGCQMHYAVKCEEKPNENSVTDTSYDPSGIKVFQRPSEIYIAE